MLVKKSPGHNYKEKKKEFEKKQNTKSGILFVFSKNKDLCDTNF